MEGGDGRALIMGMMFYFTYECRHVVRACVRNEFIPDIDDGDSLEAERSAYLIINLLEIIAFILINCGSTRLNSNASKIESGITRHFA